MFCVRRAGDTLGGAVPPDQAAQALLNMRGKCKGNEEKMSTVVCFRVTTSLNHRATHTPRDQKRMYIQYTRKTPPIPTSWTSIRIQAPPLASQMKHQPRPLPFREGRVVPTAQRQQLAHGATARSSSGGNHGRQAGGAGALAVEQKGGAVAVVVLVVVPVRAAVVAGRKNVVRCRLIPQYVCLR